MERSPFFDLSAGLKLALWPRVSISHDSGLPKGKVSSTEFTIGHNVTAREEVDAVMAEARGAGDDIVKEAHETFWGGYAGYFQDPDRHLWKIVWNPHIIPQGITYSRLMQPTYLMLPLRLRSKCAADGGVMPQGASSEPA